MELWFILSIVSAITGGIFIFTTKIAAERNYDIVLMSALSLTGSGFLFLVATVISGDFSGMTPYVLLMVCINALVYMWGNYLRHIAMQCLDTAVYYPIYKTVTPAIAIVAGFVIFSERFTQTEWVGLAISLAVPLLLITRAEKGRQKDIYRGLRILAINAVLAIIAAISIKAGTDATGNTWFFTTLVDFGIAAVAITTLVVRNKKNPIRLRIKSLQNPQFVWVMLWMTILQFIAFGAFVFAFASGPLGIVYTVQSLYILIPIVLSIIYYNEHWNIRKMTAIVLSIAALALLK